MGLALTLTLALAPALALTLSLTPTLTLTLTLTLILTLSQAWLELALGHARDERVGGHLSHVQLEPRAVPVLVVDPVPSDLRAKGDTRNIERHESARGCGHKQAAHAQWRSSP